MIKITKEQLAEIIAEEVVDYLNERCQKGYKTHPTRKTKKMGSKDSPIGTADTLPPQGKPKSRSLIDPPKSGGSKPKPRDTIETPPPIPKKRKDK